MLWADLECQLRPGETYQNQAADTLCVPAAFHSGLQARDENRMHKLNRKRLPRLPVSFETPGYNLERVSHGIVHIGVGGFHRAHMACYTHDLMAVDAAALDWGIVGAGLRASDRPLIEALTSQDGLFTLTEHDNHAVRRAVIGSIVSVIDASGSTAALLDAIDDPRTRIVSMTVTESGYCLDPATRTLNLEHEAIRVDLAAPHAPRSLPGILVEAYRRRRQAGRTAFTALSCDNIQHNGNVLKAAVLALAGRSDPALAGWIEAYATFPNSMVDRITPVPTAAERDAFAAETGIADQAPLNAEGFRQWVIEDNFADGRPAWETVGAQFVNDVTPYEFMKLRLLNASHLAVAALGQLAGHTLIGEAIANPPIRRYMAALMDRETGPTLLPVPGIDLVRYKRMLIERFANPAIRDTTQRVNTDAPLNVLIDPIRDRLAANQPINLLALGLAAWLRRVRGIGDNGEQIAVVHPLADLLAERARQGGADPRPLLSIVPLFGTLGEDPRLIDAVGGWLRSIHAVGVAATLEKAAAADLF